MIFSSLLQGKKKRKKSQVILNIQKPRFTSRFSYEIEKLDYTPKCT